MHQLSVELVKYLKTSKMIGGKFTVLLCALALVNIALAGNSDPSQAPAICAAQGSNGILVAHEDCRKFYECSGSKAVVFDCPLNLLYNSEKEYCDWAENVNCKAKDPIEKPEVDIDDEEEVVNDKINSDPSKAAEICAADGSDGILVAHVDCRKFYKCSEGKPAVLECQLNLLYNSEKEYCDWPENVNCQIKEPAEKPEVDANDKDEVVNDKVNSDPSKAEEICAAQGSDGILIAHEDCKKFYKCFEQKPAVLDCPLNLLYNREMEYCDWAENVDCKVKDPVAKPEVDIDDEQEVVNDKISSDPSKAPEICAERGSDGILIAHEQCSKFYKCSEGLPAVLDCPGNLLYNPEREYCDWSENVNCSNRT